MVVIEIFGEPQSGKTHFGVSMPNPMVLDFTKTEESKFEVLKIFGDDARYHYCSGMSIDSVLNFVRGLKNLDLRVDTLVIETSTDMRDAFGDKWCLREGRKAVFPPELYKQVNDMMDNEFIIPFHSRYNMIFTSMLGDEYVNGKKTGRMEWKGYSRMDYMTDIRLLSKPESHDVTVVKNRFMDFCGKEWIKTVYNEWSDARKLIPCEFRGILIKENRKESNEQKEK